MSFFRIGFALVLVSFLTPTFANQCPSSDTIRKCSGEKCTFQQVSGWSESIFYRDEVKSLAFQRSIVHKTPKGAELSCYYSYVDPKSHGKMPPALVLRTMIN